MKSAVIIGASSDIGRALAATLSRDGYRVGVVARRTDLLAQVRAELTGPCVIRTVDVSQPELAMPLVRELIEELAGHFWMASPQTAARQIAAAIRGRKQHVYVTRRWQLVAWLMKIVPDALCSRL